VIAGRSAEIARELKGLGLPANLLGDRYLPTLRQALRTYRTEFEVANERPSAPPGPRADPT
jgi:hypothetical protein